MSVLDRFEQRTIEIIFHDGPRLIPAHCFADWAAHRASKKSKRWRVTHLPTGSCIPGYFDSVDSAAEAAIEIAALRNDWAIIKPSDLTQRIIKQISEIAFRHSVTPASSGRAITGDHVTLNGYGASA